MAHEAGAAGRRDEHGRAAPGPHGQGSGPVPRPGSAGEHALQQQLGTTARADRFYDQQVLDHLNERMREFAQTQEMFFLATADRHGECDNSFRAGPPGFLRVLDDRTLLYPEYRGNGVHASLGNLRENPHVGLLLMDFMRARIGLHVNGRAEICEDAAIREEIPDLPVDPVPGRRAQLWVRVRVEEAYIHCAKHIPHLQKVPKGGGREWGTDDHKRKGGDFFGTARDARERGPVEWEPREHETPPSTVPAPPEAAPAPAAAAGPTPAAQDAPVPAAEPPFTPAPVLAPGQVPAPPSVPPSVPPGGPTEGPLAPPLPGHTPEPAPVAAQHQGPRHARARAAHQTPVAAWRARRQAAAASSHSTAHSAHSAAAGEPPAPGQVSAAQPGVPPQPDGYEPDRYEPDRYEPNGYEPARYEPARYEPDGYEPSGSSSQQTYVAGPHGTYVTGHSASAPHTPDAPHTPHTSYAPQDAYASGEGTYPPAGEDAHPYPSDAGYDESYAAGWHTVGMRGSGPQGQGQAPSGPVPPGVGAAVGASAVIAARGAVQADDPEAWRLEAERALAEAQQRAASEEPSSFQGWFG